MEVVSFEDDGTTSANENDSNTEISESEATNNQHEPKPGPSSLLTLLDDKNKSICLLKRQVHNQKAQLSFYLHRVFNSPKIIELAESCIPCETEENIHINLAMNQFCKQAGLKSRIMILHARMIDIEKRIMRTLEQQEEMVRVIVTRIIEFKRSSTSDANTIQQCLGQLKKDCGQVEILAKVLGATNKLRKELDTFRTCCNRLMVIEDERNSLVEQVYSMPVTQRMSYGVLLAAQYEKMRLEQEVQEIRQEQQILQERFATLAQDQGVENIPPSPRSTTCDPVDVRKMLEAVNTEAISLLEMTKEQKDKYIDEITKLREINCDLAKQVVSMQDIVKEKEELETRMQLAAKEFQKLREYDQKQLHEFNIKLLTVIDEKNGLQNKLEQYSNTNEQVKCLRSQVQEMETVKGQRDYYKLQVDDLQAIRAAYAQLVEHCPARGDEGDSTEQTGRIHVTTPTDLEKQNLQMCGEIESLGDVVHDQQSQIKHLLIIIDKLGMLREVQTPTKVKRTLYSVQTTNVEPNNANHMNNKDSGYNSDNKSVYSQTDTNMLMMMKELQRPPRFDTFNPSEIIDNNRISNRHDNRTVGERTPNYFENGYSNMQQSSQSMCDLISTHEDQFAKSNSFSFPEQPRETRNRNKIPVAVRTASAGKTSFMSTTSVEVQSVNHEGKSESLKAVLESSSPIEGVIEVNNSSALSLRLTCTPKQHKSTSMQPSLSPATSEEGLANEPSQLRIATPMDEFELLKDASRETLAVTLPSVRQKMVQMECVEYTCNNDESFDDRFATEDCLSGILEGVDEGVQVIISRESMPRENLYDDDEESDQNDEDADEEINEIDYEAIINDAAQVKCEKMKVGELTGRLQQITLNLDRTLSQPGGRDSLLSAMRLMYNTFLRDTHAKF